MADSLTFEFQENVSAALRRGIDAGTDFTPAMQAIANRMATATNLRFETETDPDGKKWKPSKRVTGYTDRHGNKVEGDGGQTLTLSTDLRGSIADRWGADYAEAGPERSGGAAIYAKIHQFGGTIRPKAKKALSFGGRLVAKVVIPARPYLGFSAADREAIPAIITDHLDQALSGGQS